MTETKRLYDELTAEELERLDKKHSCMLRLQHGWWQLGERDFKAALKQPGEWRDTTLTLLAADPSAAVNKGQPLRQSAMHLYRSTSSADLL